MATGSADLKTGFTVKQWHGDLGAMLVVRHLTTGFLASEFYVRPEESTTSGELIIGGINRRLTVK